MCQSVDIDPINRMKWKKIEKFLHRLTNWWGLDNEHADVWRRVSNMEEEFVSERRWHRLRSRLAVVTATLLTSGVRLESNLCHHERVQSPPPPAPTSPHPLLSDAAFCRCTSCFCCVLMEAGLVSAALCADPVTTTTRLGVRRRSSLSSPDGVQGGFLLSRVLFMFLPAASLSN